MAKDILLTATNALLITNGDLTVGEADGQNLEHLLMTVPGNIKAAPLTGVGLQIIGNSNLYDVRQAEGDIKAQLASDGWVREIIEFDGDNIYVKAEQG